MDPSTTAFAIDRFWSATARFADDTALEVDGTVWTYAALGRTVRALRCVLDAEATSRRVALLDQRCLTTYAGYLAVMTTGRAVVPLSRKWPRERLLAVLATAGATTVVMDTARDAELASDLAEAGCTVVEGTAPAEDSGAVPATDDVPTVRRTPDDEAYVLFTSGTTGRPKGVSISERNLAAFVAHISMLYRLGPGDRASQLFGLTFDASVHDIFGTLVNGAALVVPTATEALLPARFVNRRRLTHWYSVPSAIALATRFGALAEGSMPTLRTSLFVGEALTKEHADLWQAAAPNSVLDNVYGPTELTVTCAVYRVPSDGAPVTSNRTVPIGHPYPHVPFRVIGDTGEGGELAVGGSQMFRGYLDPADDAGRFVEVEEVQDGATVTARYYLTGDRVRWEGGEMVHLGRVDRQVKLDGYRIELAEVEAAMRERTGLVDLAVAVCRGGQVPHLAAMVVSAPDGSSSGYALEQISGLPEHMRPRHAVSRPALPLNGNGKVDHGEVERVLRADCPQDRPRDGAEPAGTGRTGR